MVEVGFLRSGQEAAGDGTIFPICNLKDGKFNFIGTGFFITVNGLFITAKHVLDNEDGPVYIVHFYEQGKYLLRPIVRASKSTESDFAVGLAANATSTSTGESLRNAILSLSSHAPSEGETVSTYAYPETEMNHSSTTTSINFVPKWYSGPVIDHRQEGTGRVNSPVLFAQVQNLGGCSGGPVFSERGDGGVVGINSSAFAEDILVVSLTSALLNVVFFDLYIDAQHREYVTVQELIDLGHVLIV